MATAKKTAVKKTTPTKTGLSPAANAAIKTTATVLKSMDKKPNVGRGQTTPNMELIPEEAMKGVMARPGTALKQGRGVTTSFSQVDEFGLFPVKKVVKKPVAKKTTKKIPGTTKNWENGKLGNDEKHAKKAPKKVAVAVDKAIGRAPAKKAAKPTYFDVAQSNADLLNRYDTVVKEIRSAGGKVNGEMTIGGVVFNYAEAAAKKSSISVKKSTNKTVTATKEHMADLVARAQSLVASAAAVGLQLDIRPTFDELTSRYVRTEVTLKPHLGKV